MRSSASAGLNFRTGTTAAEQAKPTAVHAGLLHLLLLHSSPDLTVPAWRCCTFASAEFAEFGAETAEVMMDKVTGRSRGFGFVMFTSKEGMDDAIAKRHNTEIDGRKISVRSAIPQDQIPPGGAQLIVPSG